MLVQIDPVSNTEIFTLYIDTKVLFGDNISELQHQMLDSVLCFSTKLPLGFSKELIVNGSNDNK